MRTYVISTVGGILLLCGGDAWATTTCNNGIKLPAGLKGSSMKVYTKPLGSQAPNGYHCFAVITSGPYNGYTVERLNGSGAVLEAPGKAASSPSNKGAVLATTATIQNTNVASGYALGTNNCCDLMEELATAPGNSAAIPASTIYRGADALTAPPPGWVENAGCVVEQPGGGGGIMAAPSSAVALNGLIIGWDFLAALENQYSEITSYQSTQPTGTIEVVTSTIKYEQTDSSITYYCMDGTYYNEAGQEIPPPYGGS
jgi:hypothetical protein